MNQTRAKTAALITALALLSLVSLRSSAHANPASSALSPPGARAAGAPQDSHDYRRDTMIADGIAGGALLLMMVTWPLCDAADDSNPPSGATCTPFNVNLAAAAATFSLAAPMNHLIRSNPRGALFSFLLRVGLPLGGAFGLGALGNADGTLVGVGLVGGVAAAVAIDWFVLSKTAPRSDSASSDIVPTVSPTPGGLSVGAGGVF